jgi:hypothetical protein
MRTRFDISNYIFTSDVESGCARYEASYKEDGFILNKQEEAVFKEYDRGILLNVGDRVTIPIFGAGIIVWKGYDVDSDIMTYVLYEE